MKIDEAVVLCGGLGTRLRAVVSDVPKPMAPVGERPFLEYLLEFLRRQGVRRAVLSVGYKREVIVEHFGGSWNGLEIGYAIETEPMGTGGGARLGMAETTSEAVYLLNGDSFLAAPLAPLASALERAPLAMAVRREVDTGRYGVCLFDDDGRIQGFGAGRPGEAGFINAGVYAIRRDVFDGLDLPAAFSFENDFLARSAATLGARAVPQDGAFIDIGLPESFAQAQTFVPKAFQQQ